MTKVDNQMMDSVEIRFYNVRTRPVDEQFINLKLVVLRVIKSVNS